MQTKPRNARIHVRGVGHNTLNIAPNGAVAIAANEHTLTVGSNTISATRFRNTIDRVSSFQTFALDPL